MPVETATSEVRQARAYAWFYRTRGRAEGRWRFAGPEKALSIVNYCRKSLPHGVPIGEVLRTSALAHRYEYLCIRVDVPEEVLNAIKEI